MDFPQFARAEPLLTCTEFTEFIVSDQAYLSMSLVAVIGHYPMPAKPNQFIKRNGRDSNITSVKSLNNASQTMTPHALKQWRKRLCWTQVEAARRLGLSENGFAGYEHGKWPIPKHVEYACYWLVGITATTTSGHQNIIIKTP
jgi:DNA-binding XRE family transcriptional regulator